MDITAASEAAGPGSIPGGRTLFLTLLLLAAAAPSDAAELNFQFAPVPIVDPVFERGKWDLAVWARSAATSGEDVDLDGGEGGATGRFGMSETFAFSLYVNLGIFHGALPGHADAFRVGSNSYTPVLDGRARAAVVEFNDGLSFEYQALKNARGGVILFGGPDLGLRKVTLDTPYHALLNGATPQRRAEFHAEAIRFTMGAHAGVQTGLNVSAFTLAPFYLLQLRAGGFTEFAEDAGYPEVTRSIGAGTVYVSPLTVHTVGADVIVRPWDVSLGAMLQQARARGRKAYDSKQLSLSWRFGNA